MVHNPDDGGIGGRLGGIERERGFAAADEEDVLPHAGADRIEATSVRPTGSPDTVSGCSTSSLVALRFASFMLATTEPMTRASCAPWFAPSNP